MQAKVTILRYPTMIEQLPLVMLVILALSQRATEPHQIRIIGPV